jgi:cardiolipin synthase
MIERLLGNSELQTVWAFLAWSWPYVFTVLYVGTALVASAHAVLYKREVRAAVAWSGLIWLSPFIGAALYTMFGINRIKRRATKLRTEGPDANGYFPEGAVTPVMRRQAAPADPHVTRDGSYGLQGLRRFVATVSGRRLTRGNAVVPLVDGDEGYPAMLEAIDAAQHSIALCTYIFDHDRVGKRFVEALTAAVARGVTVRVLIDGVGVRYSRPRITRLLEARGVPVAKFLKSMSPIRNPYINLRNHRKILVVDGRIGFTGGLNIREGCVLGLEPGHPVQDLHFRIEGPVVRHLMEDFALDWEFTTEEPLAGDPWFPDLEETGPVEARGIADGPDENFEAIQWTLLGGLAAARRSIRITTPYFVPDQTLIAALNLAAMRGVAVQIVLPEENNLRFVQWACMAQLWQVLINGCDVLLSPPPFDHSKLMLVDDEWTLVGSANWDARSLRLNFEFNVECYDRELAAAVAGLIDRKAASARRVTLEDLAARPLSTKLRDGVARLFSPYL